MQGSMNEQSHGAPRAERGRWLRELPPTITWAITRTGKTGLVGIALIAAAVIFMLSTYEPMRSDVASLRDDLASSKLALAKKSAPGKAVESADTRNILETLPDRNEVPKLLGVLIKQAEAAGLAIDSAKYDVSTQRSGGVTRYNVTFPVSGPYPAVRTFIDAVLKAIPNAAITELSVERKTIADGAVDANVRLSLYTRSAR
jgi:Tfp pilus assembly protein PilO